MSADDPGRAVEGASLPALLTLFSPSFPIGAYAWSHGLEAAICEGAVASADDVLAWVSHLLDNGSIWNDAVVFALAYRAFEAEDEAGVQALAHLAEALAGTRQRRAETLALGAAFAEAARPWRRRPAGEGRSRSPASGLAQTGDRFAHPAPYPVVAGCVSAEAGLPLADAVTGFLHAFAAGLVSAAVRLVPLAQSDAVVVLCRLGPALASAARRACCSTLDDLGSSALGSDIAAMRQEALRTRLFRS